LPNIIACTFASTNGVKTVTGEDGNFRVLLPIVSAASTITERRKSSSPPDITISRNKLIFPGEDRPKVIHYYREPHPFYDAEVVRNWRKEIPPPKPRSTCGRHGARVTIVHRKSGMSDHIKYWVRPDIDNRIKNARLPLLQQWAVQEIGPDYVMVKARGGSP